MRKAKDVCRTRPVHLLASKKLASGMRTVFAGRGMAAGGAGSALRAFRQPGKAAIARISITIRIFAPVLQNMADIVARLSAKLEENMPFAASGHFGGMA